MEAGSLKKAGLDWRHLLGQTLEQEHIYQPKVKGKIPEGLKGTLYRNGPGRFDRGNVRKNNLLDGDGMIQAFCFEDGKVTYQNKYVQTEKLQEEERAGKLTNETWTTLAPGGFWKNLGPPAIKSQAGISTVYKNGKLYAFDEVSAPYILDGTTLETQGQEVIGSGALQNVKAHTKFDSQSGDWILFGTSFGKVMTAHIVIQAKDGSIKNEFSMPMPRMAYMHDFFVTENYVILNLHPAKVNLLPMMTGRKAFSDALSWEPEKGSLLAILHKNGDQKPIYVEAPASWMWHSYNAYEEKDKIIADFIGYDDPDHFLGEEAAFRTIMNGHLGLANAKGLPRRYEIDPTTGEITEAILDQASSEFPMVLHAVGCHRHTVGYATAGNHNAIFHSGLTKYNFETGQSDSFDFGPMVHVGEAVLASDPEAPQDENRGWLLTLCLSGEDGKSFLAILDASAISAGPVATVQLEHHTPLSFHGAWRPAS